MKLVTPDNQLPVSNRRGVTLTEVLMSLMIMSIGVTSVAVLFPISVLRSIQATQLTNAAILKYNAEALLQMRSFMVFDPDGDGNLNEHVGRPGESNYIIDPVGYYSMTELGATYMANPTWPGDPNQTRGFADWFGNLDDDNNPATIPVPFTALPRYDGGLRSETISAAFPNGLRPDPNANPEENRALQMLASSISKLGDGWSDVLDTYAVEFVLADGSTTTAAGAGSSIAGVILPAAPDIDLTNIVDSRNNVPRNGATQLVADPETTRVVLFSIDGKFSVSFPITQVDTTVNGISWTEDLDFSGTFDAGEDLNMNGSADARALPLEFLDLSLATPAFQVGRVLIQTNRTHDFNWLLTVRRGPDGECRGVDVVVTFNKGVTPDDERVFSAAFPAGSFQFNVLSPSGFRQDGDPAWPLLKRGGYVLDVSNARWYRVRDYEESASVTVGTTTGPGFVVTLETAIVESAIGGAMFLPGVVDVYPMGSLPVPNNL